MATSKQITTFINAIGPIIQKVAIKKGYKYPSAVIAQACLESSYGTSSLASKYHNYFGLKCGSSWKGKSVNLATKEEYTVGTLTNIIANFRVYDSMELGVVGYFDFISITRYSNVKYATSYKDYITKLVADGYCTDSTYVSKIVNVITKYNLTKYDSNVVNNTTNINNTNNSTATTKVTIAKPTLKKGNNGVQVKVLQSNLNALKFTGSNGKSLTVDGDFGNNTVYALKKFQTKYRLAIDGVYGQGSYNKMNALLNK